MYLRKIDTITIVTICHKCMQKHYLMLIKLCIFLSMKIVTTLAKQKYVLFTF